MCVIREEEGVYLVQGLRLPKRSITRGRKDGHEHLMASRVTMKTTRGLPKSSMSVG